MLRLYFDLNTGLLVPGQGISGTIKVITFKRGDGLQVEINFLQGTEAAVLESVPMIQFGIKDTIDGTLLVFSEDFAEGSAENIYAANVNTNTDALLTYVTGFSKRDGVAEITISFDGGATWQSTSQELKATILNDVLKGDETAPDELPDEESWLSNRAVRYDGPQTISPAEQDQVFENLGLGAAGAGLKILLDAAGKPWLALWNITAEAFIPVALSGAGGDQTLVFLDPSDAPFV